MAVLTELSSKLHQNLKIAPNAQIKHAAKLHVIQITAVEIANAATSFPIFITRNKVNASWAFSAMTSFELEQNLYVQDNIWASIFHPTSLRTFPLYLMQSPNKEKSYTVGFNEQSDAFSTIEGLPLFHDDGKASEYLMEVTHLLDTELNNLKQSFEFGNALESLGLLKELDLKVQYADGTINVIKGLHTIDEDALKELDGDKLKQLSSVGYLTPIHALLVSLFQLNMLVTKNNAIDNKPKVASVKMEVCADVTNN